MTKPILYIMTPSPPARAALMLVRYLELEVEVKSLDFKKKEHLSEEFVKLNPLHEVPTFVDGDFVLTESRAILQYVINSRYPGSDLYPTDPQQRARVDQRLNYDHVLFNKLKLVNRPILYNGAKEIPQAARDGVTDTLTVIDKLLESSKWMAGEKLTIADFSAVTIIATLAECGYDLTKHPNINRWYRQCEPLRGFEENKRGAHELAGMLSTIFGRAVFK